MKNIILATALIALAPAVTANQSLQQSCQQIIDSKRQAQELRRKGGSSTYMNRLKKEIKHWDREYSRLRCYRIRTELKR